MGLSGFTGGALFLCGWGVWCGRFTGLRFGVGVSGLGNSEGGSYNKLGAFTGMQMKHTCRLRRILCSLDILTVLHPHCADPAHTLAPNDVWFLTVDLRVLCRVLSDLAFSGTRCCGSAAIELRR